MRAEVDALVEHRRAQIGDAKVKGSTTSRASGGRSGSTATAPHPAMSIRRRSRTTSCSSGSPAKIPFGFQYLLGVEYAVGRLSFDDAGGYERYVRELPRRAVRTGAGLGGDVLRHAAPARRRHAAVGRVARAAPGGELPPGGPVRESVPGRRVDHVVGEPATKDALGEILAGTGPSGRPALLFSATHGLGGWPAGHPDQASRRGAAVPGLAGR